MQSRLRTLVFLPLCLDRSTKRAPRLELPCCSKHLANVSTLTFCSLSSSVDLVSATNSLAHLSVLHSSIDIEAVGACQPQRQAGAVTVAIAANQTDGLEGVHIEEGDPLPVVTGSKASTATLHQYSHWHLGPHRDYGSVGSVLVPSKSRASTSRTGAAPSDPDSEPYSTTFVRSSLESKARLGLDLLFSDDGALEKSKEQLEYIVACIQCQNDLAVVLPTGGGKSAGWQVLAKLYPESISVIVTLYTLLLEDQLRSARARGIVAMQFTAAPGTSLSEKVQLVFVQPETAQTTAFKK